MRWNKLFIPFYQAQIVVCPGTAWLIGVTFACLTSHSLLSIQIEGFFDNSNKNQLKTNDPGVERSSGETKRENFCWEIKVRVKGIESRLIWWRGVFPLHHLHVWIMSTFISAYSGNDVDLIELSSEVRVSHISPLKMGNEVLGYM